MEHLNLFKQETCDHYISRINKLTPQTQGLWGKMNVAQMLSHCQKPFEMAEGTLTATTNPIFKFFFGKPARKQALGDKPFKKSLPTFKEAIIVNPVVFENEKNILINKIKTFKDRGESGVVNKQHGLFGPMSVTDWNVLLAKHLQHHLSQFGV
jgi:hypothetical protein